MHQSHFDKLLNLIAVEKEAEKEENKRELEKYPLAVREALGKTLTRLAIEADDVGVGGMPLLILAFVPASSKEARSDALSPFHAMNQGDNVRLSYPASSGLDPVDGTLYDVEEFRVTVALNAAPPGDLPSGLCQIDLLGSDATYKRMRDALKRMTRTEKPELVHLRDVCLGKAAPSKNNEEKISFFNPALNRYQQEAVLRSLSTEDVAVIHGPPGTGKTTVLVEIILQAAKRGEKVLASAPSNIAVDNIVEKLLPWNLRVVRTGHPARVMEALHHVTLTALEMEHEGRRQIRDMDEERHRLVTQLNRREERNRGRELTPHERAQMRSAIDALWKEARNQEFAIRREIIRNAQVVLTTHGSVGGQLEKQKFDLIAMDEASQATEPLSWIPLTLGKKAIFAGDSSQLPPTIYSREAAKKGLAVTLFDQLKESLPKDFQSLLRVQYRMHEDIMKFSSRHFYHGKLIADESVRRHVAAELPGVQAAGLTTAPLIYIDTAGTGYDETWNELLESRENEGEAQLVFTLVRELLALGIKESDLALLSPYVAQVKRLKVLRENLDLEIGSVDSFQGREKEVVILSLVRSNHQGEVGFLDDTRRMNVGMTRARRLLIVIGDSSTIARHPFYNEFIDYVDGLDAHRSAWEWLGT